jgi:hypothetical protein
VLGPEGFARRTLEWLSPTRVLSRFYDPKYDSKTILGAFEILDTFDERGLLIEETYRDSKGEATRIQNGCSTVQLAHDAVGNNAEYRCLNEERNLTFSTDGWSIIRSIYDERGNPVTTQLLDREGKPGNQRDFYTSIRREYNRFGKLSKETFLDSSGTGRKARSGYASISYTYDHNGNRIAEAYFDEAGRPIAIAAGYAAIRSEFDGRASKHRLRSFPRRGTPSGPKKAIRQSDMSMMSADLSTPPRSSTRMAARSTPPTDMRWCGANTMRMERFSKSRTSMTAVGR